ncbi:MAG: DNA-binding protein, partial [Thermotogae bacterium]
KHNSGWANEGVAPLYGMKFSYKDLSLSVANGDLDSNIMGDQKILLEWNYFHSLDFELPTFTYAKKIPTPKTEAFDKISDVYALPLGSRFKIRGIVISPKDLLGKGSMYIQDATGGIMVYGSAIPADLQVGDVVVVQGASKVWYGITEIVADSVEKAGSAQPRIIPLPSPSREYLSNLVMVVGSVVSKGEYDFIVDTGGYRIKVYIKKGTNIDLSRIVVGAKVRVTGILSIYEGELEILPRRQSDIVSI